MLGTMQAQLREATEAKARADKVRAHTRAHTRALTCVCACVCACVVHVRVFYVSKYPHACLRMQEILELKVLLNKSSEEVRNVQLELARIKVSPQKMPMEAKQTEKHRNKDLELEKIITVLQEEKATIEEEMKRLTEILFLFQEREKEHLRQLKEYARASTQGNIKVGSIEAPVSSGASPTASVDMAGHQSTVKMHGNQGNVKVDVSKASGSSPAAHLDGAPKLPPPVFQSKSTHSDDTGRTPATTAPAVLSPTRGSLLQTSPAAAPASQESRTPGAASSSGHNAHPSSLGDSVRGASPTANRREAQELPSSGFHKQSEPHDAPSAARGASPVSERHMSLSSQSSRPQSGDMARHQGTAKVPSRESTAKSINNWEAETQPLLTFFYSHLNPSKVRDIAQVLQAFRNDNEGLNAELRKTYGVDLISPQQEIIQQATRAQEAQKQAEAAELEANKRTEEATRQQSEAATAKEKKVEEARTQQQAGAAAAGATKEEKQGGHQPSSVTLSPNFILMPSGVGGASPILSSSISERPMSLSSQASRQSLASQGEMAGQGVPKVTCVAKRADEHIDPKRV